MARQRTRETWDGGYIHIRVDGKPLFFIEKRRGKEKFHLSTGCSRREEAQQHWLRFQADPWKYKAEMRSGRPDQYSPLYLTEELAQEFTVWQLKTKGVSRKHAKEVGERLAAWVEDLHGVDLRRSNLRDHITPALNSRKTMRGHRISTIKVFFSWLRKTKHLLISAEDPTLDLPVPKAIPEKRKRRKALTLEHVQTAMDHLGPVHRDMLTVIAATGIHFTELERFVGSPESEIDYRKRETTIAVLVLRHKNRDMVQVAITDPDVLSAAERLRKLGRVPRELPPGSTRDDFACRKLPRINQAIAWVCERAGVPVFRLGQMRATVGTWLNERGMTKEQVAAFLHHKDPRTTARFYLDVEIPTVAVSPPKLRLVAP